MSSQLGFCKGSKRVATNKERPSPGRISKLLEVSRYTVYRWIKQVKEVLRPWNIPRDIKPMPAIAIDTKYYILLTYRQ